jgi:hypothetical protein
MNNHIIAVSCCLSVLVLLTACSTQFKYQEEPTVYPVAKGRVAISYLELAFPANKSQQLALQLALVRHKTQAAKQERWLLLHHVPYQWLWVEWQGEQFHLLAAGPFNSGQKLMNQRRLIQQGVGSLNAMPAVALLVPSPNTTLTSAALAEVSTDSDSNNELSNNEVKGEEYSN